MADLETWPSVDTPADQERWSKMVRLWLEDGVHVSELTNEFRPYGDTTGMFAKVDSGESNIFGFHGELLTLTTFGISTADASLDRIDRIVLRLTKGEEISAKTELLLLPGTAQASPVPPALQNDEDTKDIDIAWVNVGHGVTTIRPQDVIDKRTFVVPKVNEQVGVVKMIYGPSAPKGYLPMIGQTVATADYPILARYWALQDFSTMVIPDMRGLVPRGATGTPGTLGGSDSFVLNANQLPSHRHEVHLAWTGGVHDHPFTPSAHSHGVTQTPHDHGFSETPHKHGVANDVGNRFAVSSAPSTLRLAGNSTPGATNEVTFTSMDLATTGGDVQPANANIGINATSAGGTINWNAALSESINGNTDYYGPGNAVTNLPAHRQLLFIIKAH